MHEIDANMRPWLERIIQDTGPLDLYDAHTHIGGNDPDGYRQTPAELIEALGSAGARGVVFPMHEPDGYGAANDAVLAAAVDQFATFGVVESVKAVSDLFAPVSGEVVEANGDLAAKPELVNSDPYDAGWMLRVRLADPAQVDDLLDADAYDALIAAG